MKKMFLGICLIIISKCSLSQLAINGIIINKVTSKPIAAATILIDNFIELTSNENGKFTTNLKPSSHHFKISCIGFETLDFTSSTANLTFELVPVNKFLEPVEIIALRNGDKGPFTKTKFSKAFIEKNNLGQDIPYLLNSIPNAVVNSDAGTGIGYTGIRIRGTDATRINMTINGIPYNDAESQGLFFVNLPDIMSSVSNIEVQRGVGTSSNGAGAFGATINFATNEYNAAPYAELNNSVGSFNTFKHTLKFGSGLLGKHITFDARASNINSDGFIDRSTSNLSSGQASLAYWAPKTSVRFNIILGKEKTYQAWYGIPEGLLHTNRTFNSAGTEKPGEPYANEADNYNQNHYQLFWNQKLDSNWNLNTAFFYTKGKGYYEQYKAEANLLNYSIAPTGKSDLVRQLWLDNDFYGQIFSINNKSKKHAFSLGGSWNNYLGNHFGNVIWIANLPNTTKFKYYNFNAHKTDFSIYAKWQQKLSTNFELFTDLQYRKVNYTINGFRNNPLLIVDNQFNFFNPKAGISYENKNWLSLLSIAVANKEPNREDFESGNTQQPSPEKLYDIELQITKKELLKNLNATATFYSMNYTNQLVLTGKINDVGAYTRTNIPVSYRNGLELELKYQLNKLAINYNGSFSRNKIKNMVEYIDNYDDGTQKENIYQKTDIAFSPNVVQNINIAYKPIKNIELSINTKHVSKQFLDNTSNNSRTLKAFTTNDFKVIYSFKTSFLRNISIATQINNLFSTNYEPNGYTFSYIYNQQQTTENYYFPMAGRNYTLAINIKF